MTRKYFNNFHNNLKENFTEKEIHNSLKDMSEDIPPSKNGSKWSSIRSFGTSLTEDFTELVNYISEKKEASKTMKTANLSLISKTKTDGTNIAKWKLISLLCVDYKIITKIITNRLLPMLNEIISSEQSAAVPAVPGHHVYDNLCTTRDLINYSNKKAHPNIHFEF